jgi:hypothetical protein
VGGGGLFGFAPAFTARSIAEFSLAAAAPLPLFVLALRREHDTGTRNRTRSISIVDAAIACIVSALVAIVLTDATELTLFGQADSPAHWRCRRSRGRPGDTGRWCSSP